MKGAVTLCKAATASLETATARLETVTARLEGPLVNVAVTQDPSDLVLEVTNTRREGNIDVGLGELWMGNGSNETGQEQWSPVAVYKYNQKNLTDLQHLGLIKPNEVITFGPKPAELKEAWRSIWRHIDESQIPQAVRLKLVLYDCVNNRWDEYWWGELSLRPERDEKLRLAGKPVRIIGNRQGPGQG